MDLLLLVLVLCLIGFGVWFLTEKIPMAPYWKEAIRIFAFIAVALALVVRYGPALPNLLP